MDEVVITDVKGTIPELSQRWLRAREAAIQKIKPELSEPQLFAQIRELSDEEFEALLSAVFLNSRNLGRSYQKANSISWDRLDFVSHLKELGAACSSQGVWSKKPTADVFTRNGCESGSRHGQRYCQYWRDAIEGLVVGISDDVGFVRNSSIHAGDSSCVDTFYDDEALPTDAIWSNQNRWGMIPEEMSIPLKAIEEKFDGFKVDLKFLGIAENKLFYKLEPRENLTCGTAGSLYRSRLEHAVKELFPALLLKDASPIAVYGEKS